MTATVRQTEPTQITTREAVHWQKCYPDYPATEWQLNYYFRGPGIGFDAAWGTEVTADGDDFDIIVPAAKTSTVTVAGEYIWQAWLTETAAATNKIKIGEGRVKIALGFDPTSRAVVETRTAAKIMLDKIDAALSAFADSDVVEYEIETPAGRRRVKRSDKASLTAERKYWAAIVENEIAREGARNGRPLLKSVKMVMYDE